MIPDDETRAGLRALLRDRVGGFFHNTRYVRGVTCGVCRGPASGSLCHQCQSQRDQFGDALADQVLTLAYARGNAPGYHQSAHTLRLYKASPPSQKAAADLALMVLAATALHQDCAAQAAETPWSGISFVPSAARPGPEHPVAELARNVYGHEPGQRFLLKPGPSIHVSDRVVLPDRFVVGAAYQDRVRGQHVLLVDDTWTSGSKTQSAALAVRAAGAGYVTVLCVARWCRHDWPDHRKVLDFFGEPYDAAVCPVTGDTCA